MNEQGEKWKKKPGKGRRKGIVKNGVIPDARCSRVIEKGRANHIGRGGE